jgi:hypothetical protein
MIIVMEVRLGIFESTRIIDPSTIIVVSGLGGSGIPGVSRWMRTRYSNPCADRGVVASTRQPSRSAGMRMTVTPFNFP